MVLVASITRVVVFCARVVVGGASVDGGRVVVVADLAEPSVVLDDDDEDAEDDPVTELGTRAETLGAVIRPSRSTVAAARSTSGASVEPEPLRLVATELLGDGTPDVDDVEDPGARPRPSASVVAVPAGLPDEKVVGGAANKIVPSSPTGSPKVRPLGSGVGSPRNRPAIMSETTLVLEVA